MPPESSIDEARPELIADYACQIGENPLWHQIEKRLYWCDIPNGRLFRYDPSNNTHEQCYQGSTIGGFTIQADGSLLLFMDQGTIARWHEDIPIQVISQIGRERSSRFTMSSLTPVGACSAAQCPPNKEKEASIDLM
jgi:sugar lactone lactonase YvrE